MWQWFREEPVQFLIGLVLAAAAAYGTWYWLSDYRTYRSEPLQVSLDEAVRAAKPHRQWVEIEDAPWDCQHFRRSGPHSYVPARTRDGALVVYHTQHHESCDELTGEPAAGILEPFSESEVREQHAEGLPGDDAVVWELAGVDFHPRQNALYGTLACGAGVLFGLFLVPIWAFLSSLRDRANSWYWRLLQNAQTAGRHNRRARWTTAAVCLAAGGVCLTLRDWYVWRVVPVPYVGIAGIVVGLFWVAMALTAD